MPDDPVTPTQDGIVWLRDGTQHDATDRRRLTGLTVIAVAVIAMMLVTVGRRREVPGAAVVPPPPQIGNCLSTLVTDQVWQGMNEGEVPVLVSAPCEGIRAGEVVSVDDKRAYSQLNCWTPTMAYLGLPSEDEPVGHSGTIWTSSSAVMTYTFGPSPLQVAAGQLWSACVVLGVDSEEFRPQPFSESPRNAAVRGGAAFDVFAFCSDSALATTSVPCSGRHRYEFVASGFNLDASEAASLDSCKAAASRLTGLADPSAGGRLRIELVAYTYDESASEPRRTTYHQARTSGGGVTCTVSPAAPDELLTSTLVGLGKRPLPIG
ncbi:MAG: hypothetical protein WKF57_17535 [Nakamurella sp.]